MVSADMVFMNDNVLIAAFDRTVDCYDRLMSFDINVGNLPIRVE